MTDPRRYHAPEPVNIGAGLEISIRDRPAPRRPARRDACGLRATTDFREGLARTIAWYTAAATL